ncbi:hypothetical protein J0X19_22135 [Hymenobacter sp. BT186]|uniref:Uncharacterized protein n=1 Tax=Hymenobacter telluris TaxID=2816474 RepID=A0A939F0U5_9BACT|nr:hypothetical protein [Hymenobacter telluris]MBO0360676.1 hypothetical protein [Hymenobacter telluris]MBW3376703.1 hypothetical protein [Hymenobacter norwichensis]
MSTQLQPKDLPGASDVVLHKSTAVERIYAASIAEANGEGPGVKGLSDADQLFNQQLESAYALLSNYHTFDQAWPLLAKQFGISRATCYRRLADAQNLMGDLKKVRKEGRKAILLEFARKILQLALTQRPPDLGKALAAMKFEANIAGLMRADSGEEEAGVGSGNTSYVINLTVEGRKPRTIDLSNLNDVQDADYELIQEAVQQSVFGGDQMQAMLLERREEGAGSGNS